MLVRLDAMGIAQKTKFSINDFFSKYEQIHSFLKSLIFCAVGLNTCHDDIKRQPPEEFYKKAVLKNFTEYLQKKLQEKKNYTKYSQKNTSVGVA